MKLLWSWVPEALIGEGIDVVGNGQLEVLRQGGGDVEQPVGDPLAQTLPADTVLSTSATTVCGGACAACGGGRTA